MAVFLHRLLVESAALLLKRQIHPVRLLDFLEVRLFQGLAAVAYSVRGSEVSQLVVGGVRAGSTLVHAEILESFGGRDLVLVVRLRVLLLRNVLALKLARL